MEEVNTIYVKVKHVVCPHCNEYVNGWICDPSGEEVVCDFCDKPFKVAIDAKIVLD